MVYVTIINADGSETVIAEQGRDGYEIVSCQSTVGLDTVSSASITVPASNRARNVLRGKNPTIAIYEDNVRVFIGSPASPITEDIYGNIIVSLDGALSWLADICKPPFRLDANENVSVTEYLTRLVTQYNAAARAERHVKLGGVTVSGIAHASHRDSYTTILDLVREVRENYGGYLLEIMGSKGDVPRLDYIAEPVIKNPMPLFFGENLVSLEQALSFDEYASRICATNGEDGVSYTATDTDAEQTWGRVDYPLKSNAETEEELQELAASLLAVMSKPFKTVTAEVIERKRNYLPGQYVDLVDRKTGLSVELLVQTVETDHLLGKRTVTCGREKIADFTARGGATSPEIRAVATDALVYETNVEAATDAWHGFTVGWNVTKNEDIINMSKGEFEPDNSDNTQLLTWSKSTLGDFWFTPQLYRPLDMPLDHSHSAIDGTSDRLYWAVQSADFSHNVRATFRLGSPINPASTSSDAFPMNRPFIRLNVNGRRAIPPSAATVTTVPSTNLATVARTYLTARENGAEFAYGSNWTYRSSDAVFTPVAAEDERPAGRGLMECDTLAFMCLIGMDYAHSPYAGSAQTADFDTVMAAHFASGGAASAYNWTGLTEQLAKPINGAWTNGLGGRIVDQSGMGWWFWDNGFVFRPLDANGKLDLTQLKSGDLALFRRVPCAMFDNLGHIGVIDIVDGEVYVIHVTVEAWTDGKVVVRSRLKDEFYNLSPGRYSLTDTYFARINYS